MNKRLIIFLFGLSFFIGYLVGQAQAIHFCVEIAFDFANRVGVDLNQFSKNSIQQALIIYKARIGL